MNEPVKTAGYAVIEPESKGRMHKEPRHPYRSGFDRDRDRIIHSQAFRRLEGKTQVFAPTVNDHYRNRLTHSIEVAQIGRTIAKVMGLNESLTEAVCLGHDLGHAPFGHAGEKILNELMSQHGGFEHNRQTVRIVELLENPYPDFTGLNLMYETVQGLAKHQSPYDNPSGHKDINCSLEGQLADIADRIAYNCHDLEDGMRSELISSQQIMQVEIFEQAYHHINAGKIKDKSVSATRTAKTIIDMLVSDCIAESVKKISDSGIHCTEDVYVRSENLITLSEGMLQKLQQLEGFLLQNLYLSKPVSDANKPVKKWLEKLFLKLCSDPELLPQRYYQLIGTQGIKRTVCDHIASMTDRFCMKMLETV